MRPAVDREFCQAAQPVIPSYSDGLHCGESVPTLGVDRTMVVIPSYSDGLHCGSIASSRRVGRITVVIPSYSDGLHCGCAPAVSVVVLE